MTENPPKRSSVVCSAVPTIHIRGTFQERLPRRPQRRTTPLRQDEKDPAKYCTGEAYATRDTCNGGTVFSLCVSIKAACGWCLALHPASVSPAANRPPPPLPHRSPRNQFWRWSAG